MMRKDTEKFINDAEGCRTISDESQNGDKTLQTGAECCEMMQQSAKACEVVVDGCERMRSICEVIQNFEKQLWKCVKVVEPLMKGAEHLREGVNRCEKVWKGADSGCRFRKGYARVQQAACGTVA